jgi:uncharacterized protein
VMMLVAAAFMIRRAVQMDNPDSKAIERQNDLNLYPQPVCKYCWLWLITEGIAVGILTGLVGVGGGFAIVPALVLLGKIPMVQAIATSLLIISFNSVAGLLGYLGHLTIDWQLTVSFAFAAAIGTLIGSYLGQFVSAKQLQKGFGYFLLAIATFVLIQNRHIFQQLSGVKTSTNYPIPSIARKGGN